MSPEPRLKTEIEHEIMRAEHPGHPLRRMFRRLRAGMDGHPALLRVYRVSVGVLGGGITALGLLLVPLPGPGWLVVFLGLTILGTEFAWAKRMSAFVKHQLDRFWAWLQARRAARA